jgi:hypothetical protein
MPSPTRSTAALCTLALTIVATGCGGDRLQRVPVSGTVTLDGQSLAKGSITFLPVGAGVAAGGMIEGGTYAIVRDDGPAPGSYKVEINATEPTGETIIDPVGNIEVPQVRNPVPARYNRNTELTAEISATEPNVFDFALEQQ